MFPRISQNVAQTFFTKPFKVAFCNESCLKLLEETKHFFGLMLKYANCTKKSKISKHFVQFCGVTSVAK